MNRTPRSRRAAPVDWDTVRRHVDALGEALEQTWQPGPDRARTILRERARELAAPPSRQEEGPQLEVIEFRLAGESYAIETAWVAEVFPLIDLTRLPGTPPFVLGIVNLRGEIVSVVDLRRFFDRPIDGLSDLNKVIVLQSREMVFGILADSVEGVRTLAAARLQGPLPTLTDRRRDYLRGIADGRIAVLDAAVLLADPRMVVDESLET